MHTIRRTPSKEGAAWDTVKQMDKQYKLVSQRYRMRIRTGFNRLKAESNVVSCEHGDELSAPIIGGNLLTT
jgi:hypothetical protein